MTTASLRKELHQAIDTIADNALLETVYSLLYKNMYIYELNPEQKKELNSRLTALDAGKTKTLPYKKSLSAIRKHIKSK